MTVVKKIKHRESPSRTHYWADKRLLKRKQRNVAKSSHGKWTYEDLVKHSQEIEKKKRKPKKQKK